MKPKFDKKKCAKCKYHGTGCGGYPVTTKSRIISIYCNYCNGDDTCLKRLDSGEVIDQRGDDYYNCKLFEEGKPKGGDARWERLRI